MAEFYERRVAPEFADTSSAPRAAQEAVAGVIKAIDGFQKTQRADGEKLRQAQYQNAATRAAIEAYQAHPDDFDAYDRDFTKNLRQTAPAVPLAEMGTYGAIASKTRERYYWTIGANRSAVQRKALKDNYLAQYESDLESGIGLMKGQLLEPDQTAAIGENLVAAFAALGATSSDGDPLFDPSERAEKLAGIGYAVLDTGLDQDIGPEMSLDAVAQLADPNFDYTVAIGGDGSDPMVFQRKDLPPQLQKKFTDGPAQKVATFLKNQNDLAAVEHFAAIYDGLDSYIPGNDGDRKAGELYARVQMDRTPFTPETLDVHTNNLRWYLQNCGFLPRSYADELAKLCNSADPLAATMGATLIDKSLEINPAAVEALDDDVVTRALLVTAELGGGTPMDVAVTRATQAMDRAMNRDRDAIDRELKAQKTGAAAGKFYGGAVTVDQYGHDGRDFFRHLVDANFRLNGGNRDLAVKRALAATRARYVETNVGFYGGRGRRVANAPEAVFGPKSAEYINRVLESHRQEITQKSAMPFEVSRLKLVATPETDRAIQTGQRPEWLLLRANDDGTADYYIDRATGRPMTFSLPDGAEDEITRWLHRMPSLDPLADDGAGAFFNLGAQLAKTHPLETAGQFFKKIWARKGESADAQ